MLHQTACLSTWLLKLKEQWCKRDHTPGIFQWSEMIRKFVPIITRTHDKFDKSSQKRKRPLQNGHVILIDWHSVTSTFPRQSKMVENKRTMLNIYTCSANNLSFLLSLLIQCILCDKAVHLRDLRGQQICLMWRNHKRLYHCLCQNNINIALA